MGLCIRRFRRLNSLVIILSLSLRHGLISDSTPLHHNFTVSFENQIKQWAAYALPVLKLNPSKTLVASFIGINDISDSEKYTFPRNGTTDFPSFYKAIIDAEFAALETVYAAGYKNYLFMGLPPLDKTPSNVNNAHPLPNLTMIEEWNSQLATSASKFESSHAGSKTMVFDTYGSLSKILANPTQYGITNTTGLCASAAAADIGWNYAAYGCLPIDQYFWYNSGHITYRVHEVLAGDVRAFLEGQAC